MSSISWERKNIEGYEGWIGRSPFVELALSPKLGSKVVSLINPKNGREWLSRTNLPLGNQGYASSFADGDGSGWDEMFPTVNACRYPVFPWDGTELPDHGEVWSLPWKSELRGNKLHCVVDGIRLPYRLEKTYSFTEAGRLRIDYLLRNRIPYPMPFLWAAHPLFQIHAGMEIIVPSGLERIAVSYSHNDRLGPRGTTRDWPRPLPEEPGIRLDVTEAAEAKTAEKFYFLGELPEGQASLYDPGTGERLTMYFPKEKVPYLSIWANYSGYLGQYHAAIEPATGFLDDLAYAKEHGMITEVTGLGSYEWYLEIELSGS